MKLRHILIAACAAGSLIAAQAAAQAPAPKAAPKTASKATTKAPAGPPASVGGKTAAQLAPGQTCAFVSQAHADASATDTGQSPNIAHDGSPLPGVTPPDISKGFQGIPRSAQPPLTASQKRILECTYRLTEGGIDMPYTLFIPSKYDPAKPNALIVDLHGLNITPLQQILFDGTTDYAEQYNYIVVAPMGLSLGGWWGSRQTNVPQGASPQTNPKTNAAYTGQELAELDAMTVLSTVRQKYNIDNNRIFLMGHSMGGQGTYYLGGAHNDIWAGLAPISGAGGLATPEAAQKVKSIPMLIMHGQKDSIVAPNTSQRSLMNLTAVGGQVIFQFAPDADHEFWIRRGAKNMERVFMFFNTISKVNNAGPFTADMFPAGRGGGGGGAAPGGGRGGPPGGGRGGSPARGG